MAQYKLTVTQNPSTTFKHEPKDSQELSDEDKVNIPEATTYIVTLDTDDDPNHEHYHVILSEDQKLKGKRNWYVYKQHVTLVEAE